MDFLGVFFVFLRFLGMRGSLSDLLAGLRFLVVFPGFSQSWLFRKIRGKQLKTAEIREWSWSCRQSHEELGMFEMFLQTEVVL